ncbi:ferredoxin [Candidatus Vecturithrix granuli]|uniref:Ferredoxin n=1 Tax=Vecturithrix granuli TaxID=1499967 RepID=A0A081C9G4_VECG1|nr:ferredoxin [Candidatus Vecturithrix granuli]
MNLTFFPEGTTIEILPEQTVLEAAQQVGVDIIATCGGKGRCKSCRIKILEGEFSPPTVQEYKELGEHGIQRQFRLACQTTARSDGVVRIVPPVVERFHQILSHTEKLQYPLDPEISKQAIILPELTQEEQTSDFEQLQQQMTSPVDRIDARVLQHLPALLLQNSRHVTCVCWNQCVIALEPGDTVEHLYGVAFDIGTTTVVGYLLNLHTGAEMAIASELNAQALYGGDLMSRISFTRQDPQGLRKLHLRILETLNRLIDALCEDAYIAPQQIYELTIVGNTCMHHLFLNIDPVHLGMAPYLAAIRQRYVVTAAEMGLNIMPQARIVMLPLIAGFVGADTVGVILATGMHKSRDLKLAIDIGTNGEIVLGTSERLLACSTAAGTAFEGAQITHGMRGASGAIDQVVIDDDVHCRVIGDVPAQGICGSGLVDAIAQMLDTGLINPMGRLLAPQEIVRQGKSLPEALERRFASQGRNKHFILLHGEETETGEPIVITQRDIRELQLAKGAIAAGIAMLMQNLHIEPENLHEILLAGAFGNYIAKESAVRIGLIPDISLERIRSVGNAAGLGSQLALLSQEARREADQIAQMTEHVALANNPAFQHTFAKAMAFPDK